MEIKLSICIATTSVRSELIKPLLASLERQLTPEVELIINDHETDCIGKKRNDMLNICKGEYQTACDSDDIISDDYVSKILAALSHNPDSVGISGIITTDGYNEKQWHISKDFGNWYEKNGVYYRTPNHISPIRTSIAKRVMFPEISFAEDYEFSMRVLPFIKSEFCIKGNIYHYQFIQNKNGN